LRDTAAVVGVAGLVGFAIAVVATLDTLADLRVTEEFAPTIAVGFALGAFGREDVFDSHATGSAIGGTTR
jgi:hypothetical protein